MGEKRLFRVILRGEIAISPLKSDSSEEKIKNI